ncbi:hypothetical protein BGZ58_010613 [Dissophora ornata]|nr:hypothetical protein BGZ58_010613 [Dissophora ornata]
MAAATGPNKTSHRSRASSAFIFPETADYHEPGYSSTTSPRLQMLSGTGSPCGEGKLKPMNEHGQLIDDDYSEIEYSDMDGEDDMIYDTPPYYHYEDEHPPQSQHIQQHLHHHPYQQQQQPHSHQLQQSRSLAFAGKGDFASLPSSSTSSSHHSLQEQEQVEEALRAR